MKHIFIIIFLLIAFNSQAQVKQYVTGMPIVAGDTIESGGQLWLALRGRTAAPITRPYANTYYQLIGPANVSPSIKPLFDSITIKRLDSLKRDFSMYQGSLVGLLMKAPNWVTKTQVHSAQLDMLVKLNNYETRRRADSAEITALKAELAATIAKVAATDAKIDSTMYEITIEPAGIEIIGTGKKRTVRAKTGEGKKE